jgi:hypothetical protein
MAPQPPPTAALRVVIAELQFIIELANADKSDPRLKQLFQDAINDLRAAAKKIIGTDPIIDKDNSEQRPPQG